MIKSSCCVTQKCLSVENFVDYVYVHTSSMFNNVLLLQRTYCQLSVYTSYLDTKKKGRSI
jgi:hypothetical protein